MIAIEDILDSAIGEFARSGVGRTTMAEMAEATGVSRQTLYGRFGGKDRLLAACVIRYCDQSQRRLEDEWRLATDLRGLLELYIRHLDRARHALLDDAAGWVRQNDRHNSATAQAIARMRDKAAGALAAQMRPYAAGMDGRGVSPQDAVRFLNTALDLPPGLPQPHVAQHRAVLIAAVLALAELPG